MIGKMTLKLDRKQKPEDHVFKKAFCGFREIPERYALFVYQPFYLEVCKNEYEYFYYFTIGKYKIEAKILSTIKL